jgi:hypothetical protein
MEFSMQYVCFHLLCDKIAVLFWKRSSQLSQTYRVISSLQVAKSEIWGLLANAELPALDSQQ